MYAEGSPKPISIPMGAAYAPISEASRSVSPTNITIAPRQPATNTGRLFGSVAFWFTVR